MYSCFVIDFVNNNPGYNISELTSEFCNQYIIEKYDRIKYRLWPNWAKRMAHDILYCLGIWVVTWRKANPSIIIM